MLKKKHFTNTQSKAYMVRLSENDLKENRSVIQIMKSGAWDDDYGHGQFEITRDDLQMFKDNFDNREAGVDIFVDFEHASAEPWKYADPTAGRAAGKFIALTIQGDALFAEIEWTKEAVSMIRDGQYNYFSPEFFTEKKDAESGKVINNLLVAGALTNRPFLKNMVPVTATDRGSKKKLPLNTLLTFNETSMLKSTCHDAELSTDGKYICTECGEADAKLLAAHEAGKKLAEKSAKKSVKAGEEDGGTDEDADEEEEEEEGEEKGEEKDEPKSAREVALRREIRKLRDDSEKSNKKWRETDRRLREMEVDEEVDALMYSEANKNGKLLDASREAVTELLLSDNMSSKDKETLRALIETLPNLKFSERGTASKPVGQSDTEKKFDEEVTKAMREGKLDYTTALRQVKAEHPELTPSHDKF